MTYPRWNLSCGFLMQTPNYIYAKTTDDVMLWIKQFAKAKLTAGKAELHFTGRSNRIEVLMTRGGVTRMFVIATKGKEVAHEPSDPIPDPSAMPTGGTSGGPQGEVASA